MLNHCDSWMRREATIASSFIRPAQSICSHLPPDVRAILAYARSEHEHPALSHAHYGAPFPLTVTPSPDLSR